MALIFRASTPNSTAQGMCDFFIGHQSQIRLEARKSAYHTIQSIKRDFDLLCETPRIISGGSDTIDWESGNPVQTFCDELKSNPALS